MAVTVYVDWEDKKVLSQIEMLNMVLDRTETEIRDFDTDFVDYLNAKFTPQELFELTEDEQREVKNHYRHFCIMDCFDEIIDDMGYEAITIDA